MNLSNLIINLDRTTSSGHCKSLRGQSKDELVIFLTQLKSKVSTKAPMLAQACDYILQNLYHEHTPQQIRQQINQYNDKKGKEQLLRHIANLEETIAMAYRGYKRLSQTNGYLPLMQMALEDHELDLSMIKFFLPRTYDQVLQRMDDMGVVKILDELRTDPTLSRVDIEKRKLKVQQICDFNDWLIEIYPRSNTVPVLVQCQLKKLAKELTTLAINICNCYDFETQEPINSGLLQAARRQMEEESSKLLSSVVNPLPIRNHLKTCHNNHFMRGLAKIGVGLATSLMSTILAVSSMSVATDIPGPSATEDTNAIVDTSSAKNNIPKQQPGATSLSSKLNSLDSLSESNMDGSPDMQPGELEQGDMVYEVEAKSSKNPFLINIITHYLGDVQQVLPMNINESPLNHSETLQTIHLAPNDYQRGETISLLIQPDGVSTISKIRMNKPCQWSLTGNLLTLQKAVNGLEITYDICDPKDDSNLALPINKSFTPPLLTDPAQNLLDITKSGKFSTREACDYLSKFTYMISPEIQRLINEMPGTQERNLSFLRIGDCDMLSGHLAWLLQGNLPCGIGYGYFDTDSDGKVYSGNAHAQFLYQDGNKISDFETTAPVQAAYIIPDSSFKPEDFESLKTIVNQITTAQSQKARDKLMTDFGNKLNEILQDPYYKKFISKNIGGNSDEQNSIFPNLFKDLNFDNFSVPDPHPKLFATLGILLSALSAIGTGSFLLGGQKRLNRLREQYNITKSGKVAILKLMSISPIEGLRVLLKPADFALTIPRRMHRTWTNKVRNQSLEQISGLLLMGDDSTLKDSYEVLFSSLSRLTNKNCVAIPKTLLEQVIKPFTEHATRIAPPYRPLWKQITTDLEQIANEGLTRSNVLALIRKHFESETLREDFCNQIPERVRHLEETPIDMFKNIQTMSDSIKQNHTRTKGHSHGSNPSRQADTSGEFDGYAKYYYGDDLRHIDWKATAKRNREDPPIKKIYTGANGKPRATHTITVVVDTHKIASKPDTLTELVTLLRLSMMKNPAVKVKIDIYSCGELIDRINEKTIEIALGQSPNNPNIVISGILTTILKKAAQEAIFKKDNPLDYLSFSAIQLNRYPQTNICFGTITDLLNKLQGQESKVGFIEHPLRSGYVCRL